jgi:hypothetical protein
VREETYELGQRARIAIEAAVISRKTFSVSAHRLTVRGIKMYALNENELTIYETT